MLRKIIGIIVLGVLLIGCGGTNNRPGPNDNFGAPPTAATYQREIKAHFNATLKDPYSVRYSFRAPVKGYANYWLDNKPTYWQGWAVGVFVNAKNSYGGYVGAEHYIFIFKKNNKIESYFAKSTLHMVKQAE